MFCRQNSWCKSTILWTLEQIWVFFAVLIFLRLKVFKLLALQPRFLIFLVSRRRSWPPGHTKWTSHWNSYPSPSRGAEKIPPSSSQSKNPNHTDTESQVLLSPHSLLLLVLFRKYLVLGCFYTKHLFFSLTHSLVAVPCSGLKVGKSTMNTFVYFPHSQRKHGLVLLVIRQIPKLNPALAAATWSFWLVLNVVLYHRMALLLSPNDRRWLPCGRGLSCSVS